MHIAQLIPALHSGDAIGNNTRTLQQHFRSLGADSQVFYLHADSEIAHCGRHFRYYNAWLEKTHNPVTILHYALPSQMNHIFSTVRGRRILIYHNITPVEFLRGYKELQKISEIGRAELKKMISVPDLSLADSEYNRLELDEMGFDNTMEMPIFIDFDAYNTSPCPVVLKLFQNRDVTTFLYVGRITPNKCQHDLISWYGFYKHHVNPRCRLILVGKYDGFENYLRKCMRLADELKIGDITFTGRVQHDELIAYYHLADAFVSMSEHEGFGVPLLEAMHMNVPVIAFSAAAVPYTMGGGGVVFHRKDRKAELSEIVHTVITNRDLNQSILKGQRKRLENFSRTTISNKWNEVLREKLNVC